MTHYLYNNFHIFIPLYENINYQTVIDKFNKQYYSNYSIYFISSKNITITHPYIRVVTIDQNINHTILQQCKNLPINDLVIVLEDVDKSLNEMWLHKMNQYVLHNKPILLFDKNKTHYWIVKVGVFRHILNHGNENVDLKQLCFEVSHENIHNYDMNNDVFEKVELKSSVKLDIPVLKNEIHLLLATYKRNKNVPLVLNMLKTQTVKNIHLHLLDNNEDTNTQKELDSLLDPFYKQLTISLHRYNKNLHCFGRISVVKEIIQHHMMDYIVIFDDDQIYRETWLENMIIQAQPLSTLSWYGKIFKVCDYWKSTLWYNEIEKMVRPEVKEWSYFGPGGSMIDIQLFSFEELYQYEKYSQDIRAIDDIWMSFVFKKYLNITFHRNITHPKCCIDANKLQKMTWANIKDKKSILFKTLSKKYEWDVTKTTHNYYNINSFFDKIYVFCNDFTNLEKFRKHHICFQWIHYDDYETDVKKMLDQCVNQNICIFHEEFNFREFYFYDCPKMIEKIQQCHQNGSFNSSMELIETITYHPSFGIYRIKNSSEEKNNDNIYMKLNFTSTTSDSGEKRILCVCPIFNQSCNKIIAYMMSQKNPNWGLLLINNNSSIHVKKEFDILKTKHDNSNIFFIENTQTLGKGECLNIGLNFFHVNNSFTHLTWMSDCDEYYQGFINNILTSFSPGVEFVYANFYERFPGKKWADINGSSYKDANDLKINYNNNVAVSAWTRIAIEKLGNFNTTSIGCEGFDYVYRTFVLLEPNQIKFVENVLMTCCCKTHSHFPREVDKINAYKKSLKYRGSIEDITIIINSYKPDKIDFLTSIHGCLNQIFVNVTVIVSTVENDPTIEFVNELENPNVQLVISKLSEHPGKGPKGIFFQLNKALKEVKTKYFSYFSSNDKIYPSKSYNEIEHIKKYKSIFCFSKYNSIFPDKNVPFNFSESKMTLNNLLKSNFINDCATIDLSRLNEPLEFNYEKYGNCSYWHLWIKLIIKHGIKCMSFNNKVEWDYIRDDKKSQAMQRAGDKNNTELYFNQREFMLSEFNLTITPRSMYTYDETNEKFWWWNHTKNTKPIELTVAIPSLNGDKIIWFALNSLMKQVNINFAWELIVFEEDGVSKKIVQSYANKLPGCVRIIYKTLSESDAFYKKEDFNKIKALSYYTLLEKWINMAKISDVNSKIFVKQAVDDYSSPKRLHIHYEHFKNDMCYYSTQPKGYFYDTTNNKWLLYDGYKREPVSWNALFDEQVEPNEDVKVSGTHLNMALRTALVKNIKFPIIPKNKGIDGYVFKSMVSMTNYRPETTKIIFTDDEIDPENWKHSLCTDGFNNISVSRTKLYTKHTVEWYIPQINYYPQDCQWTILKNFQSCTKKYYKEILENIKKTEGDVETETYFIRCKEDHDNIKITVGLPCFKSKKILWLALESLKLQTVEENWELIVIEENNENRELVKEYFQYFKMCKKIVYININLDIFDSFFLVDKWISMLYLSQSNILVLHDSDGYSSPNRLKIHIEHFNNENVLLSAQKKGFFVNLSDLSKLFFDGTNINKPNKRVYTLLKNAYRINKDVDYMSYLFTIFVNKKIDNILRTVLEYQKMTYENIAFFDDKYPDEWKYSFETQGCNTISLSRAKCFYNNVNPAYIMCTNETYKQYGYTSMNEYIPDSILKKIRTVFNRTSQIWSSNCVKFFYEKIKETLSLDTYTDPTLPTFFFGFYNVPREIKAIKDHVGKKILCFCGTDLNDIHIPQHVENIISYLKSNSDNNDIKVISISKFIKDVLDKNGIKNYYHRVGWTLNTNMHLVTKKKGILIYTSVSNPIYYGSRVYQQVFLRLKDKFDFYIVGSNKQQIQSANIRKKNITDENIQYFENAFNAYKNCFIGLRLVGFDGNANTVKELGLCGIKCIHNGDDINSIPWLANNIFFNNKRIVTMSDSEYNSILNNAVDDIIDKIMIESESIGTSDAEIRNKVLNSIDMTDECLYFDVDRVNRETLEEEERRRDAEKDSDNVMDLPIMELMTIMNDDLSVKKDVLTEEDMVEPACFDV